MNSLFNCLSPIVIPAITILTMFGCERDRLPVIQNTQNVRVAQLHLFAAGFCEPCKKELPAIQRWYEAYKGNARVRTTVHLIAGNSGGKPASQEDADGFRKDLGLIFPVTPDKYARFYKTFYKEGTIVPGTVIAADSGGVVKVYAPGIVPIEKLEADLNEILK